MNKELDSFGPGAAGTAERIAVIAASSSDDGPGLTSVEFGEALLAEFPDC